MHPAQAPASQPRRPWNPGWSSGLPLQPRLLQRQPSLNHAGPLRLRAFSQRCSRSPGSARLGSAHPRRQPSGTPPLGGLGPRLPPSPLPRASPTESQPPPGPAGASPSARVCACSGQEGTSTLGHRLRVLPREGITPSGALHPPALGGAAQTRPAGPSGRSRPLQECARGRGGRRSGLTRRDTLGMERGGVEGPGLPVGPAAPGSSTWAETWSGSRACTRGTSPGPAQGRRAGGWVGAGLLLSRGCTQPGSPHPTPSERGTPAPEGHSRSLAVLWPEDCPAGERAHTSVGNQVVLLGHAGGHLGKAPQGPGCSCSGSGPSPSSVLGPSLSPLSLVAWGG